MWDEQFDGLLREFLPFLPAEEPLAESTPLRAFGLDSLGTVELLAALEHRYDVRFRDEALTPQTFETPGSLWRTLSSLLEPTA